MFWFGRERLFDQGNASEALVWYEAAREQLGSDQAVFAHYKVAWCHYNMGYTDRAVVEMDGVIGSGVEPFRREGLKDLVQFHVDPDPQTLQIRSLTEANRKVELTGAASSSLVLSGFLQDLEASSHFTDVYLIEVDKLAQEGTMTRAFTVSARLVEGMHPRP